MTGRRPGTEDQAGCFGRWGPDMQRSLRWAAMAALLSTARVWAGSSILPAKVAEAQALGEARRLKGDGRYAEAIILVERALASREAALGREHPDVATCLILLGDLHWLQGSTRRAERSLSPPPPS